ncbi:hypothetical protein BX616_009571 [Lobosporangium transversale]|uniref:Uncharacterized protein n=1 Tax=Lobosporangium transversale TaxID=64571 RepID=A0A1Y2GMC2_9FUNG|nr:hypothetical protein BCR41DRAFT_386581 [Lobosporangium transversale]KAF9913791.1 hypothetical protein BX616_009571 [Lobosporangium transversale]ORZ15446.1 hypothetical protein BCR41DRAFT_386581 [Lobosporangium transversale]|eukprot:XP_021881194.1 hypothetical protein BCR41DRAFT_386581 [Lobosporangium transversale]
MSDQSNIKDTHCKKKDENVFKHAWYHVEEALHLRSHPPAEDIPPPVPPKDEKWLVITIDKSVPQGQEPDRSFWDKLFRKQQNSQQALEEEEAVSISIPADAALQHLGVQSDDKDLQEKKNYFERMAAKVKEKFDEDDDNSDSDSDSDSDKEDKGRPKTEQEKQELKQRRKLAPKVDPKEMKEAHRAIYGQTSVDEKAEEEAEKRLFGSWWGCHPRRSWAERKLAKQQEAEREQQRVLAELAAKRKAEQDAADAAARAAEEAARASRRRWWQLKAPETDEQKAQKAKEKERKERKSTTRKRQAIAAAAAYEAMKEYQERQAKEGKEVSHGEMKAILAGMAMAECVKLFESRHDDDDDDDDKDDMVADAGSKVLKLFELMN